MSNLRTGDVIITNKLSHTNDWVLYGVVGTVQQHGVMKYLCVKTVPFRKGTETGYFVDYKVKVLLTAADAVSIIGKNDFFEKHFDKMVDICIKDLNVDAASFMPAIPDHSAILDYFVKTKDYDGLSTYCRNLLPADAREMEGIVRAKGTKDLATSLGVEVINIAGLLRVLKSKLD